YYKTKIKSHFIFYKIEKKSNIVEIIRILHQMMDVENRLNG
ncbi:MAG: type II toxin-antitoxin system RelE/ParE family toxin, partial [Marinilabiliales bacterium]